MAVKDIIYYKKCFLHLKRSSKRGEKAPHKLILLLAVFERVKGLLDMGTAGQRMIGRNLIDLNPKLEHYFYANWHEYVDSDVFSPAFATPFYHMENEPFWTLTLKKDKAPASSQTEKKLYELYEGAYIDAELMALLINDTSREELRTFVLDLLSNRTEYFDNEGMFDFSDKVAEEPENSETTRIDKFIQYLRNKGLSESSVIKYSRQVSISAGVKEIVKRYAGVESLYSVTSTETIKQILQETKTAYFNVKGNNMYSVGISHYLRFLEYLQAAEGKIESQESHESQTDMSKKGYIRSIFRKICGF